MGIDTENNISILNRHRPSATDRQSPTSLPPAYPQQHWDTQQNHASFPDTRSGADEIRTSSTRLDKEETIIHPQKVPLSDRNDLSHSQLMSFGSLIGSTMVRQPMFGWLLSLTNAGPGSWVSICSQPGLRWVSERAGTTDFAQSAKSLTLGWSRRLKLLSPRTRAEEPEPDEAKAWTYCNGMQHPSCGISPTLAY